MIEMTRVELAMVEAGGKQTGLPTERARHGANTPNPFNVPSFGFFPSHDISGPYVEQGKRGKVEALVWYVVFRRERVARGKAEHVPMSEWYSPWEA